MLNGSLKILVTGRGTSGSWSIRGEQLGHAIDATVESNASKVKGYGFAVVVKRPRDDLLYRLRSAGVPIVWDVVDAWPQPEGNKWSEGECMSWLRSEMARVKPRALVATTKQMASDCSVFSLPTLSLPHHARPNQLRNPIRERVQTVGYEGGEKHLGAWRSALEVVCKKRGWKFVLQPQHLADLDIVVALREATGYAARNWKSNVKLANAQATGTPIIASKEKGYTETDKGGVFYVERPDDLPLAFDVLERQDRRQEVAEKLLAGTIPLQHVAEDYKAWLHQLKF